MVYRLEEGKGAGQTNLEGGRREDLIETTLLKEAARVSGRHILRRHRESMDPTVVKNREETENACMLYQESILEHIKGVLIENSGKSRQTRAHLVQKVAIE